MNLSLIGNNVTIACPACKTGSITSVSGTVSCTDCGASFPVKKGVVDLLHGSAVQRSPAQAAIDWE
jgi:uncharacterized protein YbaR (Trm112 family)